MIDILSMLNYLKISIPNKFIKTSPKIILNNQNELITTTTIRQTYNNNSFTKLSVILKLFEETNNKYIILFLKWINEIYPKILLSIRYMNNNNKEYFYILELGKDDYLCLITNTIYKEIFETHKLFNYNFIICCKEYDIKIIECLRPYVSGKKNTKNKYLINTPLMLKIIEDIKNI